MYTKHPSAHNCVAVATATLATRCQQLARTTDGAAFINERGSLRRAISYAIAMRARAVRRCQRRGVALTSPDSTVKV